MTKKISNVVVLLKPINNEPVESYIKYVLEKIKYESYVLQQNGWYVESLIFKFTEQDKRLGISINLSREEPYKAQEYALYMSLKEKYEPTEKF